MRLSILLTVSSPYEHSSKLSSTVDTTERFTGQKELEWRKSVRPRRTNGISFFRSPPDLVLTTKIPKPLAHLL